MTLVFQKEKKLPDEQDAISLHTSTCPMCMKLYDECGHPRESEIQDGAPFSTLMTPEYRDKLKLWRDKRGFGYGKVVVRQDVVQEKPSNMNPIVSSRKLSPSSWEAQQPEPQSFGSQPIGSSSVGSNPKASDTRSTTPWRAPIRHTTTLLSFNLLVIGTYVLLRTDAPEWVGWLSLLGSLNCLFIAGAVSNRNRAAQRHGSTEELPEGLHNG